MLLRYISRDLSIASEIEVIEQVVQILDKAETTISILGIRQINYKGEKISFEKIAQRILAIAASCQNADSNEKQKWDNISKKIYVLYDKFDAKIKDKNYLTRVLVSRRQF